MPLPFPNVDLEDLREAPGVVVPHVVEHRCRLHLQVVEREGGGHAPLEGVDKARAEDIGLSLAVVDRHLRVCRGLRDHGALYCVAISLTGIATFEVRGPTKASTLSWVMSFSAPFAPSVGSFLSSTMTGVIAYLPDLAVIVYRHKKGVPRRFPEGLDVPRQWGDKPYPDGLFGVGGHCADYKER